MSAMGILLAPTEEKADINKRADDDEPGARRLLAKEKWWEEEAPLEVQRHGRDDVLMADARGVHSREQGKSEFSAGQEDKVEHQAGGSAGPRRAMQGENPHAWRTSAYYSLVWAKVRFCCEPSESPLTSSLAPRWTWWPAS